MGVSSQWLITDLSPKGRSCFYPQKHLTTHWDGRTMLRKRADLFRSSAELAGNNDMGGMVR